MINFKIGSCSCISSLYQCLPIVRHWQKQHRYMRKICLPYKNQKSNGHKKAIYHLPALLFHINLVNCLADCSGEAWLWGLENTYCNYSILNFWTYNTSVCTSQVQVGYFQVSKHGDWLGSTGLCTVISPLKRTSRPVVLDWENHWSILFAVPEVTEEGHYPWKGWVIIADNNLHLLGILSQEVLAAFSPWNKIIFTQDLFLVSN